MIQISVSYTFEFIFVVCFLFVVVVVCVCVGRGGPFRIVLCVGCFGGTVLYVCIEYHI